MIDQLKSHHSAGGESAPASDGSGTHTVKVRRKLHVHGHNVLHPRRGFFHPLPLGVWLVALALAVVGLFSVNPWLTFVSILLLPLFGSLLWFRGEPPVLLFACAMQWLQASVAIFYADFYGIALAEDWELGGPEFVQATWFSMIGVLVLAIGIRLALLRRVAGIAEQVRQESLLLEPIPIFVLYLGALIVFNFLGATAGAVPAIRQPLQALFTLRWVFVFLVTYAVLLRRKLFVLLTVMVVMEILSGFMGYFGGFKDVFFILLVVLPMTKITFNFWRFVQLAALVTILLVMSIVWSVIKPEYREFLNQGSGEQEVLVSIPKRIAKFNELVRSLDRRTFADGLETVIMRLSYVKLFALTLMNVPENIPYEHGGLWLGAVKHVFAPRIFFPDKPALDDSARANYYTGHQFAGAEQGTSIGIGYMAESYVDFGKWGMFAPIFLLGVFYGAMYRYFCHSKHKILGVAMVTAILAFSAYKIETSNIKLVGGNLMSLIVMGLFAKIAGPWLWRMITRPSAAPPRGRQTALGTERYQQKRQIEKAES